MFMTHINSKWVFSCWDTLQNQLPNGFRDSFSKEAECHKYLTRNANDYTLTRNKKVFSDQNVRTSGPIFWNSLHQNYKNVKNCEAFSKPIKKSPHFTILIILVWSKTCLLLYFVVCMYFFPFNLFFYSFTYLFHSRFTL